MDRIERITAMERALDGSCAAVAELSAALERYAAVQPALRELAAYYSSPLWLEDLDADAAGELPAGLKRGVLSEDAVYDLLAENSQLLAALRDAGGMSLDDED